MNNSKLLLPSQLTIEDVKAARRELASKSLPDFACLVDIPTVPLSDAEDEDKFSVMKLDKLAKHHELLLTALQRVESGLIPNLMILMPPGSAKSTYSDVVFVPWFMARKPRRNVILASYGSDIAAKQGRRARQLIKSKSFQNLMNVTLSADNAAADQWSLSNGSEYMSGGLLSGLTGNRAALGILDDPIRGREQAESETIRKKTWEAYIDDFCSRLIPGAPQIMILTRWHQDDPAGRILPEEWDGESGVFDGRDGRTWHVICLPAIADRLDDPLGRKIGETLWPEWFSHEHWRPFQRNTRTWTSLYQQKPTPEDGDFFKSEMIIRYKKLPKLLRFYGASDYAVSHDKGDFTEHGVFGVDEQDNVYIVDWWKGQTTSDIWIDAKLDLIQRWKPVTWYGESGVIQKSIKPFLIKQMRLRKIPQYIEWLPSIVDKPTRARSIQGLMSMGMVFFPEETDENAEWLVSLISQMLKFPNGSFDDGVDVMSLIGRAIDMIRAPKEEKSARKKEPEPGTIGWVYSRTTEQKEKSKYRS
jgi:predicted phage terminase large subunit-like protein